VTRAENLLRERCSCRRPRRQVGWGSAAEDSRIFIGLGQESAFASKIDVRTTAAPRAIRFRSEQLMADCEQICDTMGISDVDLNFGVIPISHSYGFSNLLTPLIVRGIPMVLSRDRLPRAVLVDFAHTGATVFPGMPLFYQAFCEMETVPDLPKLRLCIFGRRTITAPHREQIQREIWIVDPFLLRRIGMWRDLL